MKSLGEPAFEIVCEDNHAPYTRIIKKSVDPSKSSSIQSPSDASHSRLSSQPAEAVAPASPTLPQRQYMWNNGRPKRYLHGYTLHPSLITEL